MLEKLLRMEKRPKFGLGRTSFANTNIKDEIKSKAKLKHKTTQFPSFVDGPLGKSLDKQRPTTSSVSKSIEIGR